MNEDTNSNTTSTEPSDIKSQVLAFRDNAHAANVKKLKAGIKCIFTVPACFLILLFLTGSSKIIFLVLWIASLFIIAAYLIHVEYSDYKVQEMVNSLQDTEDNIDGLIDINSIYTKVAAPKKKLDDIITNVKTDIQTQITANALSPLLLHTAMLMFTLLLIHVLFAIGFCNIKVFNHRINDNMIIRQCLL